MSDPDVCYLCRTREAENRFQVLSESGGGPFYSCRPCQLLIQGKAMESTDEECGLCGDVCRPKYTLSTYTGPDGFSTSVCDSCRKRTMFRQGRRLRGELIHE
jgi:hypothetical protein